jgi:hypothetical protein
MKPLVSTTLFIVTICTLTNCAMRDGYTSTLSQEAKDMSKNSPILGTALGTTGLLIGLPLTLTLDALDGAFGAGTSKGVGQGLQQYYGSTPNNRTTRSTFNNASSYGYPQNHSAESSGQRAFSPATQTTNPNQRNQRSDSKKQKYLLDLRSLD